MRENRNHIQEKEKKKERKVIVENVRRECKR